MRNGKKGAQLLARNRAEAGETLVETLVAVLVSSLAMLLLAMTISVSANLIMQSETIANNYYKANNDLAQVSNAAGGSSGSGNVTITGELVETGISVSVKTQDESANIPGDATVISYEANTL